tara:strand:+ start:6939 stop:8420 length:1482 start_codon:yes stop_codon:yes gene_type:complete
MKFSGPQEYIITSTKDINLFLAGVGSGKTHVVGFLSAYFITKFPTVPGFIGANTYMQLSQSTLFRVRSVWKKYFNWCEGVDYVVDIRPPKNFNTEDHEFDHYKGIISFKTGTVVFKGSLDNAKAHDGKEFGWAFLDETKDSREDDVKETILTRLRSGGIYKDHKTSQLTSEKLSPEGVKNVFFNPLYIVTSPAKVDWINTWFRLDDHQTEIMAKIFDLGDYYTLEFGNKSVVISSTYHNIENLPEGYIKKITEGLTKDKVRKLIYGNPFVKSGGEFYSSFDRTKHVGPASHKPGLPIYISLDQNVVPYITMTLYQIEEIVEKGKKMTYVTQFDEICLENPRNTTPKLCLEYIKKWGRKTKDGLYFTGDASGRKSDTRNNEHDYKIVERILKKYLNNRSNRVPHSNPRIIKRKDFINSIFEDLYDINILIDPSCKKSIKDLESLKEDINGKKSKAKVKDPKTGQYYEELGHCSDSFDYFICVAAFKSLYARSIK